MVVDNPCCPANEGAEIPDPDTIILTSVPEVNQSTSIVVVLPPCRQNNKNISDFYEIKT